MKNLLVLGLGILISASALAQSAATIEQDASDVAYQIQRSGRYLTPSERAQIARNLSEIRSVLNGQSTPRPGGRSEYTCVSRDNDGRNPYVIGIRQGIQITRIAGEVYSTENSCQTALNSTRTLGFTTLMCVSRDQDGRSPYQLASFAGDQISRIDRTQVATAQDCQNLLDGLRQNRRGQVTFCSSRDRDGRNPYVAVSLDLNNGSVQVGTESFTDLARCQQFLGN